MGPTATLIRKELRQHWLAFLALALMMCAGAIAMLVAKGFHGKSSSVFTGMRAFLLVAVPVGAMMICSRLVVAEYKAKTQLFLEGLPLTRLRMILVKYAFGLGTLTLFVAALLGIGGALFARHEALTPMFALLLFCKAMAWIWFWYAAFFTMGLLGRYRWPLAMFTAVIGGYVDARTSIQMDRFGPFHLMNAAFGSERSAWDGVAFMETFVVVAFFGIATLLLALMREGNVSAMLAEKMSNREKMFVAIVFIGGLSAVAVIENERKKPPYTLAGAVSVKGRGIVVRVAGPKEPAEALGRHLAGELVFMGEYLAIARLPDVLVTYRPDLDAGKFARGELSEAEGFVVCANYTAPGFDRQRFLAWLIPHLLDYRSGERTKLEPARWVRDGFGEFWVTRDRSMQPLSADRFLALRALYAAPGGIEHRTLEQWYRTREEHGEGVSAGLAWSGLRALSMSSGPEPCRDFLRAMYSALPRADVRAAIHDLRHPWEARLERQAGLSREAFLARWNEALSAARAELEKPLSEVPRLRMEIGQDQVSTFASVLTCRVGAEPRPAEEMAYRVRHQVLPALDVPFDEDDFIDWEARSPFEETVEVKLPESFSRGSRVAVGVSVYSEELKCDVTSGWRRIDIGK